MLVKSAVFFLFAISGFFATGQVESYVAEVSNCTAIGCHYATVLGGQCGCASVEVYRLTKVAGECECSGSVCQIAQNGNKCEVVEVYTVSSANHWILIDGECFYEVGYGASSASGCGDLGEVVDIEVYEGLCGGSLLCSCTYQAKCFTCSEFSPSCQSP